MTFRVRESRKPTNDSTMMQFGFVVLMFVEAVLEVGYNSFFLCKMENSAPGHRDVVFLIPCGSFN